MRSELPTEIQSLIGCCEVGQDAFSNDDMSAALKFAEELWSKLSIPVVWVTGKYIESDWEIQGVFDSEEKAVAACRDKSYFVGPMKLNESAPDATIPWEGAYYPLDIDT